MELHWRQGDGRELRGRTSIGPSVKSLQSAGRSRDLFQLVNNVPLCSDHQTNANRQSRRGFFAFGLKPIVRQPRSVSNLTTYTNTCILSRAEQASVLARVFPERSQSFSAGRTPRRGIPTRRVQQGLEPNDWKPIATVGSGAREIRIHTGLEHRVLYLAKFTEGVYVIHAFEKRTRKTPKRDLELARDRFRTLVMKRRTDNSTKR